MGPALQKLLRANDIVMSLEPYKFCATSKSCVIKVEIECEV